MRFCLLAFAFVLLAPCLASADEGKEPQKFQVPYRLTDTNHVLVRAKINGKGPYNFILDTGAPALFVATAVCKKLDIEGDKQKWGTFKRFELEGGVAMKDVKGRVEDPFQLEGMNGLGMAGVELHGIIGYTVLARYKLEFDFTKNKMTWIETDFKPQQPWGMGQSGGSGLEAIGSIMKVMGGLLGKKPQPTIVYRGFIGITLETQGDTVVVKTVLADSPADKAGVKSGDELKTVQGKTIRKLEDVQGAAAKLGTDEKVQLSLQRGNETIELTFQAGKGL